MTDKAKFKAKEKADMKEQQRASKEKPKESTAPRAEVLIRILSTDIPGNFKIYHGLTRIKGISWTLSNAICTSLDIEKNKKISELTEKDIERITNFLKSSNKIPEWLLNRRKDAETGLSRHLVTAELDLAKDFDIRNMKKIKSYKGWRHAIGQPVRGQRTRSHFRKGTSVGVIKSKAQKATAAEVKK